MGTTRRRLRLRPGFVSSLALPIANACALAGCAANASSAPEEGADAAASFDAGSNTADAGTPQPPLSGPDGGARGDAGSAGDAGGGTLGVDAGPSIDAGPPPLCPLGGGAGTNIHVSAGAGGGSSPAQTIAFDATGAGRAFDGIGAISGGGGNSRLLLDYPEPARTQILDYLFKPGYGAALQILKVEIGGDTNSTDGAEPSHMHTATDLDCDRGYEWWLMEEAKARNPAIKLYGLSWGAPGWIGNGSFWSQDNVSYHLAWLTCAKGHGLTIDYMGGWNEDGYDQSWFESLGSAIASAGFSTQLVCADQSDWGVGGDLAKSAAFKAACGVVGVHYPCGGDGASATSCPGDATSEGLGLPLWASENGSQDYNSGAPAMARAINRGYIDAQMTSFINWPLAAAILPGLSWETMGLLVADQPWSGWYDIGEQTWVTAHTTQFTAPGWSYATSASGYIGGDSSNGSYVTLLGPSGSARDYTVVIETADANGPQVIGFQAGSGLSTAAAHVWVTDLGSSSASDAFVHGADVSPSGGAFWLTVQPNSVYTVSTTTSACKSAAVSAPSSPSLPLPYTETFEGYSMGNLARYLSDQEGAFEVAACAGGRAGSCYRQMDDVVPIAWHNGPGAAWTIVGTGDWADYTITADVLLESAGSAELMGRFSGMDYFDPGENDAYYVSVTDSGAWSIFKNESDNGNHMTLASGTTTPLGTNTWHTLSFTLQGTTLSATLDGTALGSGSDSSLMAGPAGLSVGAASGTWLNAQFDNLSVTAL